MQEVQFYSTTMVGNSTYLGGLKMSQLNPFYKASFEFSGTLWRSKQGVVMTQQMLLLSVTSSIPTWNLKNPSKKQKNHSGNWVLLNCYFSIIFHLSFALALQRMLKSQHWLPDNFQELSFLSIRDGYSSSEDHWFLTRMMAIMVGHGGWTHKSTLVDLKN